MLWEVFTSSTKTCCENSKIMIQLLFLILLRCATCCKIFSLPGFWFRLHSEKKTVHFSRKTPLGKACKRERQEVGLRALWTELEGLPTALLSPYRWIGQEVG